jgi:hypothetical protein
MAGDCNRRARPSGGGTATGIESADYRSADAVQLEFAHKSEAGGAADR